MKTSKELLEEARQSLEAIGKDPTWYRLAKELDITQQSMWHYRHKNTVLPLEISLKMCDFLPYNEAQIIYWWGLERSKYTPPPEWRQGRERIEKALAEIPKMAKLT